MQNFSYSSAILITLLSGAMIVVQAGANSTLGRLLGHPMSASLFSFITGTLALFLVMLALKIPMPVIGKALGGPGWIWIGGLLGALYVTAAVVFAPRLGAAAFISTIVAGQAIMAIVVDHYGLFGFPVKSASPMRILGILIVFAGLVVVQVASNPNQSSSS